MFGGHIASELKRRLRKMVSSEPQSMAFTTTQIREINSAPTPRSTSRKKPSIISPDGQLNASLLSGKITSTSKLDLLKLENALLELIIDLIETENTAINSLTEELASVAKTPTKASDEGDGQVNDVDMSILTPAHAMHETISKVYHSLQGERKQAAVDIVESVFRSLQARPPPRIRTDSVRSRNTSASYSRLSSTDNQLSPKRAPMSLTTTSVLPPMSLESGHTGSSLSSISQMAIEEEELLLEDDEEQSTAKAAPSVPAAEERKTEVSVSEPSRFQLPLTSRRRSTALSRHGPPVESFSVLKVNKFRKNSPHILTVDLRTSSLVIKDANNNVKAELTEDNLVDVQKDHKYPQCILIFYKLVHKSATEVISKRYRFGNERLLDTFFKSCQSNIPLEARRYSTTQSVQNTPIMSHTGHFSYTPDSDRSSGTTVSSVKKMPPLPVTKKQASPAPPSYKPSPIDVSQVSIPDDVYDAIEALTENLHRLWTRNKSKYEYQIDKIEVQKSQRMRLKDQLKLFMGKDGDASVLEHDLAYYISEKLIKCILARSYTISSVANEDSADKPVPLSSAELDSLKNVLASDSNDLWCKLALRCRSRRAKYQKTKLRKKKMQSGLSRTFGGQQAELLGMAAVEAQRIMAARRAASKSVTAPRPPKAQHQMSKSVDASGVQEIKSMFEAAEDAPERTSVSRPSRLPSEMDAPPVEAPPPPPSATSLKPTGPPVSISAFKDLKPEAQQFHLADVNELFRTIAESSFVVHKK